MYQGHVAFESREGGVGKNCLLVSPRIAMFTVDGILVSVPSGKLTLVFGGKPGLASNSTPILASIYDVLNLSFRLPTTFQTMHTSTSCLL